MWATSQQPRTEKERRRGFTIVELLIVIVVIGILAAIVIVAYNGIQQRAHVAVLQSDVKNASGQLEIDNVNNGTYPASTAAANGGQGLKASPGTTWQYTYTSSGNSYCLTGTNSAVSYFVSSANNVPQAGACPGDVNGGSGTGLTVTTLAGSTAGTSNGTGSAAQFRAPFGIAIDSSGTLYVADAGNNLIRKVTSGGVVTTLAGSGSAAFADGTGTGASFNAPDGVAVDSSGNVYVADTGNNRIREITPGGVVTTIAGNSTCAYLDGSVASAEFCSPTGIAVDSSGAIYVAGNSDQRIRKIASGTVTTFAGSGAGTAADGTTSTASFYYPYGLALDSSGDVYVADTGNSNIREIASGYVTTLAGNGTAAFADGTGSSAQFWAPTGLTVAGGGTLYVADGNNNRIRKVTSGGVVTTIAGSGTAGFADGTARSAQFNAPKGIAIDSSGALYVTDTANNRIRKLQ